MTKATSFDLTVSALCAIGVFVGLGLSPTYGETGHGEERGIDWTIVQTYSIPEGASGLAYDGVYLYCGIYGVNGDQVYQIDPATGAYTLYFSGVQEDAYGLTYDGTYLWTTDHPGSSSTPAVAMQLDSDGSLITHIDLPDHYMSGIAYDDGDFWVSRYYPDPGHVYKIDGSGAIIEQFDAPDNQPWDLCVQGENLWIADYWGDTLYQVEAHSGTLLYSHASEGVDPAGIVWDGQYLWYCDNGEGGVDYLYKVDLQGGGTPVINLPVTEHDFGPVVIADSASWYVTVENNGTADLHVSGVSFVPPANLSCPTGVPVTIRPGLSDQIQIQYSPDDFAPLDAVATVASDDPIHPTVEITLAGHGVYADPHIDVGDGFHYYGSVRAGATTRWFMEIQNQGATLLTLDDIAIDDPAFYLDDAVTLPIHVGTLASVEVGVWFNPAQEATYIGTLTIDSNDPYQSPTDVPLSGIGVEAQYPMGEGLWSYLITTGYDPSPKAMAPIPDISGDGVADVIVCSEDNYVRCLNGNADGTGDVLWEHEIYSGAVYLQEALEIIEDIDSDGYADVVVGSAWGGRLIRALSGKTGAAIWTHYTDEYGDGGWVYDVDCSYDYNDDGVVDVLAAVGDDGNDTGPNRAYCLNGLTGATIWATPLGGPGFGVLGVEDFTGDGQPDAVAGASNADETVGRVFGIDGADGGIEWTYLVNGSSVWALAQSDDITSDGVRDIMVGDFSYVGGYLYGLSAIDGKEEYAYSGYGAIMRLESVGDVNGDGHPDFIPAHFGTTARVVNGQTGVPIWNKPLVDKSAAVAAIPDVNDDGVGDVVVGTLYTNNYAYFLDGVNGATLGSINYGNPIDAITTIPDIVGDGSWEMVVGGREGLVTCYSGGIGADCNSNGVPDWQDIANCVDDPDCMDCNENGLPDECDAIGGGDFDVDADVDLDDYAAFADCMAGADATPAPVVAACATACLAAFDADDDGDVDLADFAEFQFAFDGGI